MAIETQRAPAPSGLIADRALYRTEDGRVVEEGDTDAAYLLAAPGSFIDPRDAQRFGLSSKGGKVSIPSRKEMADAARAAGQPVDLGTPNEGKIRKAGEPLILVPRTGVLRPEPAERVVLKHGDEVEMVAASSAALVPKEMAAVQVSNVPPEDDELRAQVAEETTDEAAVEREAKAVAERAAESPKAKKSASKRAKK